MHLTEKIILTSACGIVFISIGLIPQKKADKATFVFLVTQFFTWILGLIAVEYNLLSYPFRELSKSNATSFLFEFLILPVMTVFFILHYPHHKDLKSRLLYYMSITSAFTLVEYVLEKYTLVIEYHAWKWYWTWLSMLLVFYMVMVLYKWFYREEKIFLI